MEEISIVRALRAEDIPAALELSCEAGWNQTADDWRMLLELEPEGCFAVDYDGELAATATLVCYGRRLAWLGMVLTREGCRRRGFASALISHALAIADARHIETVKLDATDRGQPLYERFGFVAEQAVERWSGVGLSRASRSAESTSADVAGLDREAFPADRSRVLPGLARGRSRWTRAVLR